MEPEGVAVVGASTDESSVGHAIFKNLLYGSMDGSNRANGFGGPVYPVNPDGGEILGETVYKDVTKIDGPLNLAVVAIPPQFIPGVIDQAGQADINSAIIISAGFSDSGEKGEKLQQELLANASDHGIRLMGPNCLGIIRPSLNLNASFGAEMPPEGGIGLLSQSGALITGLVSSAIEEQYGLSCAVSLGDKADLDDREMMEVLGEDEQTDVVSIYLEAAQSARSFYETLDELNRTKPVVVLKGGRTEGGAAAASSHTGSMAGSHRAYEAAFRQAGVHVADSIQQFMAWSRALSTQPVAEGDRVAIVTNAGGPGVLSADAVSREGLRLAELSEQTMEKLDEVLPPVWSKNNPIDIIGDAPPERYRKALDIVGSAEEVDAVVLIMTRQAMTRPVDAAEAIADAHDNPEWSKPLICSLTGMQGTKVGSLLDKRGVPDFNTPELAVSALRALVERGRYERSTPSPNVENIDHPVPHLDTARELVGSAQEKGTSNLPLSNAREVLASAGIRYNESGTAQSVDEAVKLSEEIGYPVVIKLNSPDVIHKSDAGGVILDVVDEEGVREACQSIETDIKQSHPDARLDGFTVEEQVSGTELIVGTSQDPDFGTLIMVGMGGIFVEVYEDVSFRLVPLERADAHGMIDEIDAQPLLNGARNRPKLDRGELAEVILRISNLVEACPGIKELDINPLVLTDDGLVAIDGRVILS